MDFIQAKTPYLQKWEQEQLGTSPTECYEDNLSKKKRKGEDALSEAARKELHNQVEKRRRDRLTNITNELRSLVPNSKHLPANKATILHQAADHIRKLTQVNKELLEANQRLQDASNQQLSELAEIHRLLWSHYPAVAAVVLGPNTSQSNSTGLGNLATMALTSPQSPIITGPMIINQNGYPGTSHILNDNAGIMSSLSNPSALSINIPITPHHFIGSNAGLMNSVMPPISSMPTSLPTSISSISAIPNMSTIPSISSISSIPSMSTIPSINSMVPVSTLSMNLVKTSYYNNGIYNQEIMKDSTLMLPINQSPIANLSIGSK